MGQRRKALKLICNVLTQYLSSPWPPCSYIIPHFFSLILICAIFIWRVRKELLRERTNTYFSTKKDLTPISRKKIILKPKIWMNNMNTLHEIQIITFSSLLISPQGILHQTSKHHFNRLPTRSINSSWLPFHSSLKLLNLTWF